MKEINFEIKIPAVRLSREQNIRLKIGLSFLVAVGAFIAGEKFEFAFFGTLILAYFGLTLIWRLTSRLAASFALLSLAGVPMFLILGREALAETFAVYAYYFLVITVVQEIVLLRGGKTASFWPVDNFSGHKNEKNL